MRIPITFILATLQSLTPFAIRRCRQRGSRVSGNGNSSADGPTLIQSSAIKETHPRALPPSLPVIDVSQPPKTPVVTKSLPHQISLAQKTDPKFSCGVR